ncbi:MAG TPA: hypothetical protein ENI20_03250 [Bacteroides sp.]|nr:hypothetical protein [Bacteroides sp.]
MKLHEDKKLFTQAVLYTAQQMKIKELYVEKDYWVCFVLDFIFKQEYRDDLLFKGGTSLTKCFSLLECIVTVDLNTGKNMLVWEKTQDVGTVGYHIYREKTIGQYELIGQVMNPENQPYLNKITSVDTCGNESELDDVSYHKPIFLNWSGQITQSREFQTLETT